jgi:hypothetical protein
MLHSVPLLTVISKGVSEPAFSSAGEQPNIEVLSLRRLMFREHKVLRPYSDALPIYAQERRANGGPTARPH